MPELPEPRHHTAMTVAQLVPAPQGYAELRCRSNFSFLEGASHPDELVSRAAELGYTALAVTDRNSLAGVVRAHAAARETGMKLLVGSEITPRDGCPVVLLPTDRAAYGRLCRLLTVGRRRAPKGECELRVADVARFAEGMIGIAHVPAPTSVAAEEFSAAQQEASLQSYREIFGDRGYLFAERHLASDEVPHLRRLMELSERTGLPLVATNDVHYHIPQRRELQDVLTATRLGCTVAELGRRAFPNAERSLKSPEQMAALFPRHPEWLTRTVEIAERCRFSLDELRYEYPEELAPSGKTPLEFLRELTWEGAAHRYPQGVPPKVRRLIEHELALIEELHYEAYFLTVWDLVRYARSRDILCQGRGSAANSAVCFCLGVTAVDPDRIDVLFERFISKERNEAPDIDVDFEHERREEVLQYIYEKYGRERAGMTASLITYRVRSAIRDVGKALGLSLDRVDLLAKTFGWVHDESKMAVRFREAGLDPETPIAQQLQSLVLEILGFPRHLSQHVGGMVMTRGPLCELVPIENAAMPGRTVIEWDKDDLDELGILKVDCLCLGMLSALRRCLRMLEGAGVGLAQLPHVREGAKGGRPTSSTTTEETTAVPIADLMAAVPPEDPAVYRMIQRADTVGVFQIESRAQMSMLPRLKPRCFYDLVIEVAIVRPGPIQGDMVHPYLRRRCGEEQVDYPNEEVRTVLDKTLGVPIFQEQAMRLAVVAAGFSPGEADQLRRAMGAWRKTGVIDKFRVKLLEGMQAQGYDEEFAQRVFNQIRGFGEYGFPESHAASFALLVYVSAWLKHYYPAAFCAGLINSQPMGFYAPAQLVADAMRHGVQIFPIDVNHSHWDCTLENGDPHALRLGLRMIKGLAPALAEKIVTLRTTWGPFTSFDEFAHRTGFGNAVLERLAEADAFRSLDDNRRESFWNALPSRAPAILFDRAPEEPVSERSEPEEPRVTLPMMSPVDEVVTDYQTVGLSLKDHPIKFLRPYLQTVGARECRELEDWEDERKVKVAGMILLRQRPSTARGITFMTLEDETGQANLVIHPNTWERFHQAARKANVLLVRGLVQKQDRIIHVVVDWIEDLSNHMAKLSSQSRDFR